jgi:AraC-like DNA-binding protein/quercetin dioxygenase-like cupin family protein
MPNQNQIPIHDLVETDDTSCRIIRLNVPSDYSTNEAHRHSYYEILFFSSGTGKHMIDFDTHEIKPQSIHFVAAGQVHAMSRSADTKGFVIAFSKEFMFLNATDISILNEFPAFNKTAQPVLSLPEEVFQETEGLINDMEREFNGTNPYKDKMLGAFICILLLKCKSLLQITGNEKNDIASRQVLLRFNDLLEEKFIELHKVNEYADLMNLSPNHLSETIKKITGKTAGELIQDRLILEAKRLLLHSAITAKEIAYHLNFNDPSYFSRFFKTNTGLSPEEFRKQTREKYQH